jgi:chemotaxis protein methyltransferase CheR
MMLADRRRKIWILASSKRTEGVLIYDLGNRQWNIATLRTLLEHILPDKVVMTDFLVEHEFSHDWPQSDAASCPQAAAIP